MDNEKFWETKAAYLKRENEQLRDQLLTLGIKGGTIALAEPEKDETGETEATGILHDEPYEGATHG